MPLAWLGFHPLHIMFLCGDAVPVIWYAQAIGKLGWIEKILVTPSHHHVHHASNTPYLDKNMGMLFIAWDKLFGTFKAEGAIPSRFAMRGVCAGSRSPWALFTYELRNIWHDVVLPNIERVAAALLCVAPPGW